MALSTQPYKGARDFYPEDMRLQNYMFGVWRNVCERFGYEEYGAPILEPTELYLAKGNQEIIDEQTYTFIDRGDRSVTIRTEMTPTVSRMVAARRQELVYPLRWYSVPNLWRYERPQGGRLREFWQLNADIFGVKDISAELEILQIIDACFKEFGASADMYSISLNHRELIDYLLDDYLKLGDKTKRQVAALIDRMKKIERTTFIAKIDAILTAKQKSDGVTEKLLAILEAKSLKDLPRHVLKEQPVQELDKLLARLAKLGINNVRFDPTLMRGFDYYTGVVFEAFDTDSENRRSLLGGGRYDGLVAAFGVEAIPTVGFAWGDVTLEKFLHGHHLIPKLSQVVEMRVLLAGDILDEAQPLIKQLRDAKLGVAIDLTGRKLSDQLRAANKSDTTFVAIIGEQEVKDDLINFKDLSSGKEYRTKPAEFLKNLKTLKTK